jgi:hypothetical protein
MLLRWSVGAVGAGSIPGSAVGGSRFGVLHLGKGVPYSAISKPPFNSKSLKRVKN